MNIFHRNHLHLFMSLLLLLLCLCCACDLMCSDFYRPGPACSVSVIVVDPFIISLGARAHVNIAASNSFRTAVADHHFMWKCSSYLSSIINYICAECSLKVSHCRRMPLSVPGMPYSRSSTTSYLWFLTVVMVIHFEQKLHEKHIKKCVRHGTCPPVCACVSV